MPLISSSYLAALVSNLAYLTVIKTFCVSNVRSVKGSHLPNSRCWPTVDPHSYDVSARHCSKADNVMERPEAYILLTEEMNKLTELVPDQLEALRETMIEFDRRGASGNFYYLEMVVEQIASARFVIVGKIHDNDTHSFSLLEERLEFEVSENN